MKSVVIKGIIVVAIFGSGILTGIFYSRGQIKSLHISKIQEANTNYKYTAPLLGIDIAQVNSFPEYRSLKQKINSIIQNYKDNKNLTQASVYYRNLNNSSWLGINELEEYSPGSLFKVPIMIAYLKQAETDPNILQQKFKFDDPKLKSEQQDIPPSKTIEFGKEYTVEELLQYTIAYSDNNAANVLASKIYLDGNNSYTKMMGDLGLSVFTDQISAKQYSIFLRILYNSTYLNPEMSEKALGIMANTEFKDGLLAGTPPNISVAHKFGQYGVYEDNKIVEEFHECGIIYAAKSPYLLCIMTKGDNKNTQMNLIKDISQQVYDEINK